MCYLIVFLRDKIFLSIFVLEKSVAISKLHFVDEIFSLCGIQLIEAQCKFLMKTKNKFFQQK